MDSPRAVMFGIPLFPESNVQVFTPVAIVAAILPTSQVWNFPGGSACRYDQDKLLSESVASLCGLELKHNIKLN
jgi:hypothetical protein